MHGFLANRFGYELNEGMSFGLEIGGWQFLIMLLVLGISYHLFKERKGIIWFYMGGMANLVDRAIYGGVRDYWNFFGLWVNNINDWVIFVGMVILIVELWKENIK